MNPTRAFKALHFLDARRRRYQPYDRCDDFVNDRIITCSYTRPLGALWSHPPSVCVSLCCVVAMVRELPLAAGWSCTFAFSIGVGISSIGLEIVIDANEVPWAKLGDDEWWEISPDQEEELYKNMPPHVMIDVPAFECPQN